MAVYLSFDFRSARRRPGNWPPFHIPDALARSPAGMAGIWRWMKIVHRSALSNRIGNALRWRHGESPAPPAVLGIRMAGIRALLAGAPQGRLYLRHCRFLVPRH